MIGWATILFAVAALGGATLAFMRFKSASNPPTWLALVHGAVAALALVLLILGVIGAGKMNLAALALFLFIIAAMGGFFLFTHHLRKQLMPMLVVGIHGAAAAVAFVLLVIAQL